MTEPAAAPASPPPDQPGLLDDFLDIFASPVGVFARRAKASPAAPYFIVSALIVGLFIVNRNIMAPIMDAEMQKALESAMKANPGMPAEGVERMKGFMRMSFQIAGIVGVPLALLVLGLITWGVGRAIGGTLSYGTALLISSFAWIPRVVESVLISVQGLVIDSSTFTSHYQLQLGVARFMDPASTNAMVLALVGRVDLITLWVTLLFALGLVHAGKVPKERMVAAGALMWVLGSLFPLWGALRSG